MSQLVVSLLMLLANDINAGRLDLAVSPKFNCDLQRAWIREGSLDLNDGTAAQKYLEQIEQTKDDALLMSVFENIQGANCK